MNLRLGIIAMLAFATIFNGWAEETNSPAVVEDLFAAPLPVTTNAPAKLPMMVVQTYHVEGNTVLSPADFGMLSNYTGEVDFPHLREGLGKLQLRYRNLGFPTISVTLPQQKLTNGVVRVKVVEGKISDIVVTGNRYYSTGNIRRALPSLTTNVLLNTKWFQPELDRANQNQNRQIYPVIAPGPEPGTTALTLKVKDQFPLHGHMELNDYSTPETPLLRLDTALQYDNLWQLNHQIGLDYNFSPQEMKPGNYSPNFFDQPMVASYSGYYRLPLGFGSGLRENYEHLPVTFGYDEVNHQFNLPPATGNPDLIFYASRSISDTPVKFGPMSAIDSGTNSLQVTQQSGVSDLVIDVNLGTKLSIPLQEFAGVHSTLMFGFDYKSFEGRYSNTNFIYAHNTNGVSVLTPPLEIPNNSVGKVYYMPLSLGWIGVRPDKWGSTSFSYNENFFFSPLESSRTNFQGVANSLRAGGNFTTLTAGLIRLQNLPGNWSVLLNANGQWASSPLIGNEQFALGGLAGVRGYQTGENYGDTGWRTQCDLRAPPVNIGYFPTGSSDVPATLRCSIFMDYGEAYHLDATVPTIHQWGTGTAFYLNAGSHFDARLTLAYALLATPTTPSGGLQAYFSVGYQF